MTAMLERLTSTEVIQRARAARQAEQTAAVEQLVAALDWAHLHPCPTGQMPAHHDEVDLHGEALCPLAGPGAPLVAEFAPAELGAALGITLDAARSLIGDALELAHRLPRLWDLVVAHDVLVWRARAIAEHTRDLSAEAVLYADRLIAAVPGRIGSVAAARLVQEARLYFDPDRALADEETALARRGVWLHPTATPATTEVSMLLDTPDAELLDATVARIAHDLRDLGDRDPLDVRRARAVGILADPQHALDLMSGRDNAAPSAGLGAGVANLYVHLTPADLATDLGTDLTAVPADTGSTGSPGRSGACTIERLGAATTRLLTDWLTRLTDRGGRVVVRPVLTVAAHPDTDTRTEPAVDRHDPSEAIREAVVLRDAHCVFPGCRRDSRACDLDHITPYVPVEAGGLLGQTRPSALAPLCRTHHRVKTHTAWTYRRLPDGRYLWTSPTGHSYEVTVPDRRPPAPPGDPPHPPASHRGHTASGLARPCGSRSSEEPDHPGPRPKQHSSGPQGCPPSGSTSQTW